MICPSCGTIINDKEQQCRFCGHRFTEELSLVRADSSTDIAGGILDSLKRALATAERLEEIEDEEVDFAERRQEIEKGRQEILDDDMPVALAVIALLTVIVVGGLASEDFLGMIIAIVITLIVFGIIHAIYSSLTKASREEKANSYYNSHMEFLEKEEQAHREKVKAFEKKPDVAGALDFLPEKYRDYETISSLIQLFNERRADTLKEALNLYEEDVHRRRVQEIQETQRKEMESRQQCPQCGGRNCTLMTETTTKKDGYSAADGCCGFVLLGPIGLLCGACGAGEETKSKTYWMCQDCGNKFNS